MTLPSPAAPYTVSSSCRGCGAPGLQTVLEFGDMPLANSLLAAEDDLAASPRYPMTLAFCPACALVQLRESVSPEALFRNYVYFSSVSESYLAHVRGYVEEICAGRPWPPGSLVVEIASNDGYLLQFYRRHSIPVLGIEPAENIARQAIANGIDTVVEFFGTAVAEGLARSGRRADVIHANNVLAHVPDVIGVLRGIRILLKPDGMAVIEAPYLRDLLAKLEFDTIYHEHLYYFSVTAVQALAARSGLILSDVKHVAVHGGSLRMTLRRDDSATAAVSPAVTAMLQEEAAWGVRTMAPYREFAEKSRTLARNLKEFLVRLKAQNKRIAGYGAAAKGSTLVNFARIGTETIDYVVDRSTAKQGRRMPGMGLPILPPGHLRADRPDFVLLLAWNLADEIVRQESWYSAAGGRFIVPVPEPRIL
jgi:hypothetical protein